MLLEKELDGRWRDVLAASGNDELLLATDDAVIASFVDRGDVPGVQPTVAVARLGGGVRVFVIALHQAARSDEDFAVFGESHLHTGRGHPDRAVTNRITRIAGRSAGELGHAPRLDHAQPDGLEELD